MNIRKLLVRTAAFVTLACALPAHAAGEETGTIQPGWNIFGDGNLFFYLSGTHVNSPCPIAERWALDTTSPVGKSQYSAFLLAYSTGKTVRLAGTGGCTHGNTETVFDFVVEQ